MKKHIKYLDYVIRHKWFVLMAGLKIKAPLWRLLIHDWSKFLPCEWFPYAEFFYGEHVTQEDVDRCFRVIGGKIETTKEEFDRAWNHHQKFNKHHWQYWVLQKDDGSTKVLEMPKKYMLEMVADWMGAGRAITGKWKSHDRWEIQYWFEANVFKMKLHTTTEVSVDQIIDTLK